ncbi:MAG: MFS transporter [Bacteroidales bacterium]|nr:MFS transporter [Bacteroidales bacterium]
MKSTSQKLSVREKIGYSLGDSAANFIFQTLMIFQLIFYTDTFGITAAAAGTLLLVVRVWDAIFDPMMGAIADRTKTRWGKFRPWIIWTALPFGIMAVLAFTTPNFSASGKLVYAYITYILLMMVYSANNLPYSALSGVMTGDMEERTSLSSYRFVFAMMAAFVVQGLALPMVNLFGQGDTAKGYQYTFGIFGILAVIFFIITFASTKERILPDPKQKTSLKQDFSDLFKNGPWIAMFFLTLLVFIHLAMRGGVMLYFFKYYLNQQHLSNFINHFGFLSRLAGDDIPGTAFSLFNIAGNVAMIIGILFSKMLAKRFGKRNVYIGGLAMTTIFAVFFITLGPGSVAPAFLYQILYGLSYGITIPLLWAMIADVADYSEWKNRRRATGIVFSAVVFGLKAGLGVGGAIGAYLLSLYGYIPNAVQGEQAIMGIRLTASIYPAIAFIISLVALSFYRINKKLEYQMQDELAERRKSFTTE